MTSGVAAQSGPQPRPFHISLQLMESKLALPERDQHRVDEAICRLQRNPENPGLSLERIEARKGRRPSNLWSARVSDGLRLILAREGPSTAVLFAGRHDDAYRWAEARRAGLHPATGEFQLVLYPEEPAAEPKPLAPRTARPLLRMPARTLVEAGVPEEWAELLLQVTDEEELLRDLTLLPEGVGDRVLELIEGRKPSVPKRPDSPEEAFSIPTARKWLWAPGSEVDLKRILTEPFETWRLFLHPSQAELVEIEAAGPVKVTGAPGTGKSVVAMHRAAFLARQGKRVLLLSYTKNLCGSLRRGLGKLLPEHEMRRVEVGTIDSTAGKVLGASQSDGVNWTVQGDQVLRRLLDDHLNRGPYGPDRDLARLEWEGVIRLQALSTWDEYRLADRSGRAQGLAEGRRSEIWRLIEPFLTELQRRRWTSFSHQRRRAWERILAQGLPESMRFDAVIVDELQDLTAPAIRLVAALAKDNLSNLMVVGDGGQRIYPGGFSLRKLGIDAPSTRSRRLRVNYRTTAEIQAFAAKLRGSGDDLDGGSEVAEDTTAILRGRAPEIRAFGTETEHDDYLMREVGGLLYDGFKLSDIAILSRNWAELDRIRRFFTTNGLSSYRIDSGSCRGIALRSLHGVKGLEFRAAFVVRCEEGVLPDVHDDIAGEDTLLRAEEQARELALLYVGLTRARERIVATYVGRPSPFLALLQDEPCEGAPS